MWVQTDESARISPASLTTKPSNAVVLKRTADPAGRSATRGDLGPESFAGHERAVVGDRVARLGAIAEADADPAGGKPRRGPEACLERLASGEPEGPGAPGHGGLPDRRWRADRCDAGVGGAHATTELLEEGGIRLGALHATGGGELGGHARHLGLVAVADRVRGRAPVAEQRVEVAVEPFGGVVELALVAWISHRSGLRGGRRDGARGTGGRGRCRS